MSLVCVYIYILIYSKLYSLIKLQTHHCIWSKYKWTLIKKKYIKYYLLQVILNLNTNMRFKRYFNNSDIICGATHIWLKHHFFLPRYLSIQCIQRMVPFGNMATSGPSSLPLWLIKINFELRTLSPKGPPVS